MLDNLLPEGFKDEVSNLAAIEHKYKNKIIDLFQSYGYELVKTPLIEFAEHINNKNTLKIDYLTSSEKMTADVTKIRQILLNLLSNSAKFTKKMFYLLALLQERKLHFLTIFYL